MSRTLLRGKGRESELTEVEGEHSGRFQERRWGSDILVQSLGPMWRCPAEDQDTAAGTAFVSLLRTLEGQGYRALRNQRFPGYIKIH